MLLIKMNMMMDREKLDNTNYKEWIILIKLNRVVEPYLKAYWNSAISLNT